MMCCSAQRRSIRAVVMMGCLVHVDDMVVVREDIESHAFTHMSVSPLYLVDGMSRGSGRPHFEPSGVVRPDSLPMRSGSGFRLIEQDSSSISYPRYPLRLFCQSSSPDRVGWEAWLTVGNQRTSCLLYSRRARYMRRDQYQILVGVEERWSRSKGK